MPHILRLAFAGWVCTAALAVAAGPPPGAILWDTTAIRCQLVPPATDDAAAVLARSTLDRYLQTFFGKQLPVAKDADLAGTYLVLGTPANNPVIGRLVKDGLKLTAMNLGDEGFQIITWQDAKSKYIVIYGNTPRALKHGCQELVFFRISATVQNVLADWPIDAAMRPDFAYRGIYMLPCWSAMDSLDSWKRVLRFNSELTLNRVWFWLDGFPIVGHTGGYAKTDLANEKNVQSLIDQVNADDMKFYIGGGWMMWHQEWAVGKDPAKATDYYLAYLRTFKNVGGFYFEPAGEIGQSANWRPECESLRALIRRAQAEHPGFEVAIAIGRYNQREYWELMSELNPKQTFWWWCWGDPHDDNPWEFFPSILEWHTTWVHGPASHPGTSMQEKHMLGQVTSYDPGMGFGNPWTGWAKMGVDKRRDFDPYSMPYFSHEYRYRERCWNTRTNDNEFARRLGRRLFDADTHADAIGLYLKLADMCWVPVDADMKLVDKIDTFVAANGDKGTPRNRDTFRRMAEAVKGIREFKNKPPAK